MVRKYGISLTLFTHPNRTRSSLHSRIASVKLHIRSDKDGIAASLTEVYELFPRLKDRAGKIAGNLSGGEQQMLAIARALMAKPKRLAAGNLGSKARFSLHADAGISITS
jgi:ABC-type phosphate transport system ATPase subunit